jgi:hypothetical protein
LVLSDGDSPRAESPGRERTNDGEGPKSTDLPRKGREHVAV